MNEGPSMIDADAMATLRTRREVRGFLARGLNDLIGGEPQQDLPAELSNLATGSDREVIESYQRLDKSCESRSTAGSKRPGTMSREIRDLFGKALQRMKELPPDPREVLSAKPQS